MSAPVLMNLLNELGKGITCEAFYLFFTARIRNSIIHDHECKIIFIT